MKYHELVIEDPRVARDTSHTRKWVVTWRVFDQKIELEKNRKRRFFFKCMADGYAGQLMHSAPHVPQIDRTPPEGYGWQQSKRGDDGTYYYLAEQPNYYGATALFMVMEYSPGHITPIAEKCYLNHGVEIIDALRYMQEQTQKVLDEPSKNKEFPISG